MICPNCNKEIKDGYLLCSHCGKELSVVPTFDAEIEVIMDDALSGVNLSMEDTKDLSGHPELAYTKDLSKTASIEELKEKLGRTSSKTNYRQKRLLIACVITILLTITIVIFGINHYSKVNSNEELIIRANEAVSLGDYETAIPLYEKALSKDDSMLDAKYGLANSYYLTGNTEEAKKVLTEIVSENDSFRDAYALLITIYEQNSEYMLINDLINECKNPEIYDEFKQYIAPSPGFSDDEGEYDSSFQLKLLVDTPGNIYYTLDGSEPDDSSFLYTEPISLAQGKNVVRAVFINEYGIKSESVSKIYEITNILPDAPVITPDDGTYNRPDYIYAQISDEKTIYYTTDGSMPDEKCHEYLYPIPLKVGNNTYKFVSIDDNGQRSDVVTKNYDLEISAGFSESEAVNYLVNSFTANGKLADVSGVSATLDGMYQFKCVALVESNGKIAYLIEELYKNSDENSEYLSTENYYGVDINDATIYTAVRKDDGKFALN